MTPGVGKPKNPSGLSALATVRRDDFSLDLDLQIADGGIVGLTGDIGSGKTSALLLLAGLLKAADGSVSHQGVTWDEPSTGVFVASRPVALMSQLYLNDLPEDVEGTSLVEGASTPRPDPTVSDSAGANSAAADSVDSAAELLSGLGVEPHVADRLPWTWSGAEAQRIALARAVAARPQLLLLDEPFTALDKRTSANVRAWLADWLARFDGIAVVASTRADHLGPLVDRIVSLDG